MDEQTWMQSADPRAMVQHLIGGEDPDLPPVRPRDRPPWKRVSERKLRLFVDACREIVASKSKLEIKWSPLDAEGGITPRLATWLGDEDHAWERECPLSLRCQILREIFGNPFQPGYRLTDKREQWTSNLSGTGKAGRTFTYLPRHWFTPTVLAVASSIYEERRWEEMPILADALSEAGCDNAEMLNHARGLETCWHCQGKEGKMTSDSHGYMDYWQNCGYCCNPAEPFKPTTCSGLLPLRGQHCRGCWLISPILGQE